MVVQIQEIFYFYSKLRNTFNVGQGVANAPSSSYNSVHPCGPEARLDESIYKFSSIYIDIQVQHNCHFYFDPNASKIVMRVGFFGNFMMKQWEIQTFFVMRPTKHSDSAHFDMHTIFVRLKLRKLEIFENLENHSFGLLVDSTLVN